MASHNTASLAHYQKLMTILLESFANISNFNHSLAVQDPYTLMKYLEMQVRFISFLMNHSLTINSIEQ